MQLTMECHTFWSFFKCSQTVRSGNSGEGTVTWEKILASFKNRNVVA